MIGAAIVDLLRSSGCFTLEEAQEYIDIGALNGLFVLGRTIGFVGTYIPSLVILTSDISVSINIFNLFRPLS